MKNLIIGIAFIAGYVADFVIWIIKKFKAIFMLIAVFFLASIAFMLLCCVTAQHEEYNADPRGELMGIDFYN